MADGASLDAPSPPELRATEGSAVAAIDPAVALELPRDAMSRAAVRRVVGALLGVGVSAPASAVNMTLCGYDSVDDEDVDADISQLGDDYVFDGDGAMDLAAGAPDAIDRGEVPGVVVVWAAPAPGRHDLTDADALFGSGSATADAFGCRMGAGDIDGRDELAIGAPLDDELAQSAAMVAIVPGGGL